CVALLAIVNGHLEVSDAFFGMRIVLRLLRRLSMLKRGFSVLCCDVCVALLAIVNGYLRIFDGFGQMILGYCDTPPQQGSDAKTKGESENPAIHNCIPPYAYSPDDGGLGVETGAFSRHPPDDSLSEGEVAAF